MAKRVSNREAASPAPAASAASKVSRTTRTTRSKKTITPDTETITEMLTQEQAEPAAAEALAIPAAPSIAPQIEEVTTTSAAAMTIKAAATTDQIAKLAYTFWQERGCPISSGEEDWFRAERQLLTVR